MSHTVDYLPVATAVGNNADSQANFAGSGYQLHGFVNGVAQPYQANKLWRQTSMLAAAFANFISNELNIDILDDGDINALITNLTNAIMQAARNAGNTIVSVPFSATPVFDCSLGSKFQMVLTGNVTSSTLINIPPGVTLRFIIKQDGTGGHTFAPPANLPMNFPVPSAPNQVFTQVFMADNAGNLFVETPMTAS